MDKYYAQIRNYLKLLEISLKRAFFILFYTCLFLEK